MALSPAGASFPRHQKQSAISLISSSIIAGLGLFGLAVNGICPLMTTQLSASDPGELPSRSESEKQLNAPVFRFEAGCDEPAVASGMVPQCTL